MEILQEVNLKAIINDGLQNSISYPDYRELVKQLVAKQSTTGEETEDRVNFTMLNDKRMKRWDKTIKVSEAVQDKMSAFNKNMTWLVIAESWCGDAAHVIPAINKVAELNQGKIDFKVVMRDENLPLMNQFLTNGGMAIPKLIMIDNASGEVVNTFGPRPNTATKMVSDYKAEHGKITPEFKEDLQHWYNKDKGQSVIEDLIGLL